MEDALAAWLSTPVGEWANIYVGQGFHVFPVHGTREDLTCTCGNPDCGRNTGKHPFTKNGLNDAVANIVEVASLFQYRADLNIAIRTGSVSGIFVLDVDFRASGAESIEAMETTYERLPKSIIMATGNGFHVYFNYPADSKVPTRVKLMPGVDIKSDGGYVVAPPSRHLSGKHYDLSPTSGRNTVAAPDWFLSLIRARSKEDRKPLSQDHSTGAHHEWPREEVERMLDTLDSDLAYDDWLHVGMALHSGGYPLSLWDGWSRCGEKFENGDCESRWHGFNAGHGITMGTLIDMARLQGWKPPERERPDTSTVLPLVRKAEEMRKLRPVSRMQALGFDPMELPGLIGDTVRWITSRAMFKQPELSLLNTLAFAGAIFGRAYASPVNTRTNIYTVGIAETASGKDNSRKSIKELAHAAGLDRAVGADSIRSDSGLLRGLMNNSSQVMMIDEFGLYLRGVADEKAPHYIRAQAKVLLELYSTSNSVYNHGDYADKKSENIIIQYPNLCIYGTSTEENYVKSLRKASVNSGELNRFVAIKARSEKQYPPREMPSYDMDALLAERWGVFAPGFGSSLGHIINDSFAVPDVTTIPWGECAGIQHGIICRQVDKTHENQPCKNLWGRLYENTLKIAMILAIARDKDAPEFIAEDFDMGQMIVESSIAYLTSLATDHMSENAQEDHNIEVIKAIKDAGGRMGRRDIMRKFRKLKRREFDDVVNGLIDQEVLESEKEGAKTYYRIAEGEKAA